MWHSNLVTSDGLKENYYYTLTEGGVFAVLESVNGEDVTVSKPYSPVSDMVSGYNFSRVFDYDGDTVYYGTTALVTGLYELASNGEIEEHVVIADGVTFYYFSFTSAEVYGYETQYLYEVTVVFSLGAGGNYERVSVISERYACEAEEGEEEEPKNYHKVNLYPIAVFEYDIEQTVGARDLTAKYSPDTVLTKDFKLTYADGSEVQNSTIKAEAGSFITLYLVPTSENAVIALDSITASGEGLNINVWDSESSINFFTSAAGNYTFTVKTLASKEKTVTVEVSAPALESLYPYINDGGVMIESSETTVETDANRVASITVTARPNAYADGAHTAAITAGDTASATLVKNADGSYTLNTTALGTWTITFTAKSDANITATLKITTKLPATEEEKLLAGHKYYYGNGNALSSIFFTFGNDGTLLVEDYKFFGYLSGNYTYVQNVNSIEILKENGEQANFIIAPAQGGEGYTFVCYDRQGEFAIPSLIVKVVEEEDDNGGEVDVAAEIKNAFYENPGVGNFDFEYNWYNEETAPYYYYDFTYTVEGTDIIVTWKTTPPPALVGATFSYDTETGNIVASYPDGSTDEYTKWMGWGT